MVRLKAIDRRVLYLVTAALVLLTRFVPLGLPVSISPLVQHTFNTVENLPNGSVVVRLALAQYEHLVGHGGVALRERDAMSAPALIVTLFVVLGNAGDLAAGLAARRRRRKAHGLRPGAGGTRTDDETGPGD